MNINKVIHGNSLVELKKLEENSVDSIVCDPPYELTSSKNSKKGFMGKEWDGSGISFNVELWRECLRVLKPGGHLLAFSGTRTYHRMTCAIEDAGFEIRDMLEWLYFSGFPKSMDISKQFDKMAGVEREVLKKHRGGSYTENSITGGTSNGGTQGGFNYKAEFDLTAPSTPLAQKWNGWGTALKPAHEPIVLARKPLSEKTVALNVEKWGTGGINVDASRIGTDDTRGKSSMTALGQNSGWNAHNNKEVIAGSECGRFPANCITLEEDEFYSKYFNITPKEISKKASKKDRNSDVEGNEIDGEEKKLEKEDYLRQAEKRETKSKNNHPTVKPIDLMTWLIRLVTPENGIVLDPFSGSGSTLVAAKKEGFGYIGIELNEKYVEIIKKRLKIEDLEENKNE